ncbi:hypothetical protein SapgrDRAFT_1140 [Saprospira grandis DSM 2844]|uniref:Uncharacterized protein n=1 Tax=Saprospira grandis DSM 2844 TaxID=694433 RepID=J1I2D9_9BACT|nr:hypothetical protein [Saprospira grandis]EJF52865.1 hypothetical protein SapgrDRAFT_1140 [Saprospira grandis DSM 2844]
MKHLFLFLCLFCSSFIFAQHYEVGKTYNFDGKKVQLSVRYDDKGQAHISQKAQTKEVEDQAYFFTDRDYWTNISADENVVEMDLVEDAPVHHFWVIDLNGEPTKATPYSEYKGGEGSQLLLEANSVIFE